MNCIICDKNANATGSHIVPASLIKNCIGKHYAEKSYEIDSTKATVDIYYGRDNPQTIDTTIKKHHHKEDEILCQTCEDKLGELERDFSSEFLQKFRLEKFKNNFNSYKLDLGFEIIEPNKLNNLKNHAYIYSIILRFCRDIGKQSENILLTENELDKIKTFVNGFLYDHEISYTESISDFRLILTFDKYSNKGSFVFALEECENPYLFYFCEVIVQLFTKGVSEKAKHLFNGCINSIEETKSKFIVGPSQHYHDLLLPAQKTIMKEIVTNGTKELCVLNKKSYNKNLMEFNELVTEYDSKGIKEPVFKALDALREKYGG